MKKIILKSIKSIVRKLPPKVQMAFSNYRGILLPLYLNKSLKELKRYFTNNENAFMNKENKWSWEKAFRKNLWTTPENIEVAKSFASAEIKPIQVNHFKQNTNDLIVICVVKNDLERMKMFYEHYRNIGVKHFVILDNDSTDGTREWLLEQPDSDIYLVEEKFNSQKKYGWINKLLNIYGFNRWYLYADSDELFVFEDIEDHNIEDLIQFAEKSKLTRIAAIMIDMYSDKGLFKNQLKRTNITQEYVYFDPDTYTVTRNYKGLVISGGPRKRVINSENEGFGPLLTKHPLFYFQKGNVFESAHYIFPFETNAFLGAALLHYKFLESDLERYRIIAKEGNFSKGSREYKEYIKSYETNTDLTFMYDGSVKYVSSSSLKKIPHIEKIRWDELEK